MMIALRIGLALGIALGAKVSAAEPDVNAGIEKAMKAAIKRASPSVVKIETAGGLDKAGGGKRGGRPSKGIHFGTGATTGLIVDPDGYVITSSFNFANKPTDIFVTAPGRSTRFVAKVVATDQTRMLTLLKIDAKGLPMPQAYSKKEVRVGQWALALGRTLDTNIEHPPSVSVGIMSAVNRLLGKAFQTDAKTSPTNYGGPLIAIDGRIFGVIVPASSRGGGETSGFEWYDSGIGFAIPLEDILAKLPEMKKGGTLRRGLLGINPKTTDVYNSAPVIGAIQPDSAADRTGLKVGDVILAINGKPTPNYSRVQHILGPLYEGDSIQLKVKRGEKELAFAKVALLGTATAYVNAFLGILPLRDDPSPGVVIRFVYPNSPAAGAGLKPGDRIMKLAPASVPALAPVRNRQQLAAMLQQLRPGTEIQIEVKRKQGGKTEKVTTRLVPMPNAIPDKLPMPSSAGKALEAQPKGKGLETKPKIPLPKKPAPSPAPMPKGKGRSATRTPAIPLFDFALPFQAPITNVVFQDDPFSPKKKGSKEKVETGFMERTDEALGRKYWLYVPDNYDANVSHGLLVWFHPAGKGGKDGAIMARTFREFCEDRHFIMMGPKSANAEGWLPSETELVVADVRKVLNQYTIDKNRVAAHGMGNGGQMAFYVGFHARDVFRGVATLGASLGTPPKENVANQPLSFFIAVGDKDPALKEVEASKQSLEEKRFPVVYRLMKESGKEYYDEKIFSEFLNWLDSLDRL